MSGDANGGETTRLSPDEAFGALGNRTRMDILHALGDAGEPLSFSELRARVGIGDSGQFNYHLDRLTGHFVRKTGEGYRLGAAGRRVVESVLSGAVTAVPEFEPTAVDWPCPYCGGPVEVTYDESTPRPVKPYCTECAGLEGFAEPFGRGQLASLQLAPAGIRGRDPGEMLRAAITWEHLENLAAYAGVCPRCSAAIEHSITVCETHDRTDGRCTDCNRPYAATLYSRCSNCIFDIEELFAAEIVIATVEMLSFLTAHDRNPVTDPWGPVIGTAEEEILSTDPFEARFTYTVDDDRLSLTVDETLTVVEATNSLSSER